MFKSYLEKRKKTILEKKDDLSKRVEASQDPNEVRSLTSQVIELNKELAEVDEGLKVIEERAGQVPAGATKKNEISLAKFENPTKLEKKENVFESLEYRQAFMKHAQTGAPIPADLLQRAGTPANTDTLGATIPVTVMNEFINEIRVRYGNLYNKVRKLSIKGSLKFPISRLMASFKWVTESTTAPKENAGTINEYVQFDYNIGEIRVAQTLLANIVSLDIFEREIVNIMIIAFLKAMDEGIVRGTGNGQLLGILNDPRVLATGNVVNFTAEDMNDWTKWRSKFFAKLPLGYRYGEFIFPLSTVETYLETMADANNNPVFQQATGLIVNDGDALNPNGRFFGREISLVEPDILPDFDTANEGDVIGIFWQPDEYAINTNMDFALRRYFDEDTNEWIDKLLLVVDGKVLNPCGIWLIKKAVAEA